MEIKAIIFDFDGLILDTETPDYLAWQSVYKKYGVDFPLDHYLSFVGKDFLNVGPIDYLIAHAKTPLTHQYIKDAFDKLVKSLYERQSLCAGVIDYLNAAKELDLSIGLASSSESNWVLPHLEKYNILDYFDVISTVDNVDLPKPDPALYNRTISLLNIKPSEAIAFEDSYNGLKAAKEAGLNVVAVPNEVTRHLDLSQANMCLPSLADISLQELIDTFQSK